MAKITFRSVDGDIIVDANNDETLFDAASRSGVKLFGGCGGAGVCGTCHVYIDPEFVEKLNEASLEEMDLMEVIPNGKVNSRLACQIIISDALEGMIVTIP